MYWLHLNSSDNSCISSNISEKCHDEGLRYAAIPNSCNVNQLEMRVSRHWCVSSVVQYWIVLCLGLKTQGQDSKSKTKNETKTKAIKLKSKTETKIVKIPSHDVSRTRQYLNTSISEAGYANFHQLLQKLVTIATSLEWLQNNREICFPGHYAHVLQLHWMTSLFGLVFRWHQTSD